MHRRSVFLSILFLVGSLTVVAPTATQADDDASANEKIQELPLPQAGGQCSASAAASKSSVADIKAAILLSQIAANSAAEQATATTDGVLNNRGYNYGPDPDAFDFAVIQREIELQKEAESK